MEVNQSIKTNFIWTIPLFQSCCKAKTIYVSVISYYVCKAALKQSILLKALYK